MLFLMRACVRIAVLAGLLGMGCSPVKPGAGGAGEEAGAAKEVAGEEAAAQETGRRVRFVYHYPGAVQRNLHYDWREVGDGYVNGRGIRMDGSLFEALFAASGEDLLGAAHAYGCRSVEGGAQLRVQFIHEGREYALMSASNCLYASPFNVLVDGRRHVQLSGKIGRALRELLVLEDKSFWSGKFLEPGFVDLSRPLTPSFDVPAGEAGGDVLSPFWSILRGGDSGAGVFGDVSLEGALLELGCNQALRSDCSSMVGRVSVALGEGIYFRQPIRLEDGALAGEYPKDLGVMVLALGSVGVGSYVRSHQADADGAETEAGAVWVGWDMGEDCGLMRALLPHFEGAGGSSCATWTVGTDSDAGGVYYEGLGAFWLSPETDMAKYFESLCSEKGLVSETRRFCSRGTWRVMSWEGAHVFIGAKGSLYVFRTREGRTYRESL